MPKKVCIQVKGVDQTIVINADKVEESGTRGSVSYVLWISKDDQPVGKFDGLSVVGWWITDTERWILKSKNQHLRLVTPRVTNAPDQHMWLCGKPGNPHRIPSGFAREPADFNRENAHPLPGSGKKAMKLFGSYIRQNPRTAGALAFGTVTLAVQHFLWVPDARMSGLAPALTVLAALVHAVAGAITGPRLVDRVRTRTPSQAGLLGAGTSLLALMLFAPLFTAFLFATDIHSAGTLSYIALPFLIAAFAFLGDGWALFLVSIVIGWALYRVTGGHPADWAPFMLRSALPATFEKTACRRFLWRRQKRDERRAEGHGGCAFPDFDVNYLADTFGHESE
jgi:hypothetical protein